ncbi:MAG: NADH-quinone oxidoreductase subunit NuoK [Acidobacteria bacterium]|nr:MAG: NADH-quinone oxidoreductase subunit NuoK [Acidobacteriota bacterium]
MSVPLQAYLAVAAILFGLGVYGVLSQRGAVMVLMSTEVILNAAMLNTVAFWRYRNPADFAGQIFALVILTIAAVEMAVGLAVIVLVYRNRSTQMVDRVASLRG